VQIRSIFSMNSNSVRLAHCRDARWKSTPMMRFHDLETAATLSQILHQSVKDAVLAVKV
jgi:hypothetical protein